ncbi:hypothetical protein BDR06DRAFT_971540 [Suillus hirtellus]|nr:hypothetical protein BDR06DRAFT_971540 [Suillus hirtellus]
MPPQKKKTSQLASKTTATGTPVVPIPVVHAPVVPTPVVSTPVVPTPVAALTAAAPTAAALPIRFRQDDGDEGEFFDLENVLEDEDDDVVSPAPEVRPAAGHSPFQTAMSTTLTDPLATGGQAKPPKSSTDVHFFFRQDPTTHSNICKACEKIHNLDDTYHVATYVHNTSTSTRHTHAFTEHTDIYLEEAERQCWHVLHKLSRLKTFLDEGWTIATMRQRLRDPDCTLDSLGTPPSPDLLPGTSL